jgi:hypothetical protein
MTNSDRPNCTETVHHGRMGFFPCSNAALPDDTLCGTHRAAQARREAAPKEAPPQEPPHVIVKHSVSATLEWPRGKGPTFRAPYDTRDTMWDWIRIKVDAADGPSAGSVSGLGAALRKDGTPGEQRVELQFARFRELPQFIQDQLREALS